MHQNMNKRLNLAYYFPNLDSMCTEQLNFITD